MKINVNAAAVFLAAVLVLGVSPKAFAVTITETTIPTNNSQPNGVARADNGEIWFTEEAASKIGRVNPSTGAIINEYPTNTANASPTGIASLDNFMWFTEQTANRIARINQSGVVEEFPTGMAGALPNAIAVGPGNVLYFTETGTGKLGSVDASNGNVTEISNVILSSPAGIVQGPDNKMWITESGSNRVSRFDPVSGVLTRFNLPSGSAPAGITVGPDDFIWFTMPGTNRVGKIDPGNSNAITEYSAGISTNSQPNQIVSGSDGNLWYTAKSGGRIARVTTSGGIVEFTSGITSGFALRGIAAESGTSALFFASAANRIAKVTDLTTIPTTIRFEMDPFKVSEDCGEAIINVFRDGDTSTAVSVDYATSDDSAKVGDDDYEARSGQLSFGVGVTKQSFTIKILSGGGVESVEDVRLSLLNPTGGAVISTPSAKLQIFDGARLDDEGFGDTCDDIKLGGCTLHKRSGFDPTMPVLIVLAAVAIIAQRFIRKHNAK